MDQEFFHKGYVAGWQSINGRDLLLSYRRRRFKLGERLTC
jgi:hypothetical protein